MKTFSLGILKDALSFILSAYKKICDFFYNEYILYRSENK